MATATKTPPATAEQPRGLTAEERSILDDLLGRAGLKVVSSTPPVGGRWQALMNLSVPRHNDPTHQCDLVARGEVKILTDEQAALFLPPNKPVPLIRRVSDQQEPLPRITGREVSGPLRVPAFIPGAETARPDPAGSTTIQVVEVPESAPPVIGSQNDGGEDIEAQRTVLADAMDLRVNRG